MSIGETYEELQETLRLSEAGRSSAIRRAEEIGQKLDAIGRYMNRVHSFSGNRDSAREELEAAAKAITDELQQLRAAAPASSPATEGGKDAIALISSERKRQIEVEGWTTTHDDYEHTNGELAKAAACYAHGECDEWWPWADGWWKPTPNDRIRELVKAGALVVAEIERLQRDARTRAAVIALARLREAVEGMAEALEGSRRYLDCLWGERAKELVAEIDAALAAAGKGQATKPAKESDRQ